MDTHGSILTRVGFHQPKLKFSNLLLTAEFYIKVMLDNYGDYDMLLNMRWRYCSSSHVGYAVVVRDFHLNYFLFGPLLHPNRLAGGLDNSLHPRVVL